MSTISVSVDEFQALEQKVLRAVEIVRRERLLRAEAEAEIDTLRNQLAEQMGIASDTAATLKTLEDERLHIRARVEKMLEQMDELL
jgi:hypothetical protein